MTQPLGADLAEVVRSRLRAMLGERHLTYTAAAAELGVTTTWLSRRLRPKTASHGPTDISLGDLELICDRLDIPLSAILPNGNDRPEGA